MEWWELIRRNIRRQMETTSTQRQSATLQARRRDGDPDRNTRVET